MYFDFYRCSIPLLVDPVMDALCPALGELVSDIEEGRPGLNSYKYSTIAYDAVGEQVFRVLYGGVNAGTNIIAPGGYAREVSAVIRNEFQEHNVSRMDAAFDIVEPGFFDRIWPVFRDFATDRGLSWRTDGDWRSEGQRTGGRTFYVGKREGSFHYLRVYEKGWQVLKKMRPCDDPPDLNWVRVEMETKPQERRIKGMASSFTPFDCWGSGKWARAALGEFGVDTDKVVVWKRKETDAYRSVRWMLRQYRRSMGEVIKAEGGYAQFMDFAHRVWSEMDGHDDGNFGWGAFDDAA